MSTLVRVSFLAPCRNQHCTGQTVNIRTGWHRIYIHIFPCTTNKLKRRSEHMNTINKNKQNDSGNTSTTSTSKRMEKFMCVYVYACCVMCQGQKEVLCNRNSVTQTINTTKQTSKQTNKALDKRTNVPPESILAFDHYACRFCRLSENSIEIFRTSMQAGFKALDTLS